MLRALAQRTPSTFVVRDAPVTVPHVAIGIWAALAFVVLCPDPRKSKDKQGSSDGELLRAYGIAMTPFSLL